MAVVIDFLQPTGGKVGDPVSIGGSGFGATQGSGTVTFSGATATILTWSDTLIECEIAGSPFPGEGNVTVEVTGDDTTSGTDVFWLFSLDNITSNFFYGEYQYPEVADSHERTIADASDMNRAYEMIELLKRSVIQSAVDTKIPQWDDTSKAFLGKTPTEILAQVLTTRGDVLRRGASAPERLALGAAGTVLTSDGTDAAWATLDAAPLRAAVPADIDPIAFLNSLPGSSAPWEFEDFDTNTSLTSKGWTAVNGPLFTFDTSGTGYFVLKSDLSASGSNLRGYVRSITNSGWIACKMRLVSRMWSGSWHGGLWLKHASNAQLDTIMRGPSASFTDERESQHVFFSHYNSVSSWNSNNYQQRYTHGWTYFATRRMSDRRTLNYMSLDGIQWFLWNDHTHGSSSWFNLNYAGPFHEANNTSTSVAFDWVGWKTSA